MNDTWCYSQDFGSDITLIWSYIWTVFWYDTIATNTSALCPMALTYQLTNNLIQKVWKMGQSEKIYFKLSLKRLDHSFFKRKSVNYISNVIFIQ